MRHIHSLDKESSSSLFSGPKTKLVLHLRAVGAAEKRPGPSDSSTAAYVKLAASSAGGIDHRFIASLGDVLAARIWEADQQSQQQQQQQPQQRSSAANAPAASRQLRSGIVGIERRIQERQKETDDTISTAFRDLSQLMVLAKDMVAVSQAISAKVVQRQGDISDDETVRLKAHLLGLGIENPVLRDSVRDASTFHALLSHEIATMLLDPIRAAGGMMPLAEAYCRVNRARGMELLSPDDVLQACRLFGGGGGGALQLRTFAGTGTMVLQLESHDDAIVAREIVELLERAPAADGEENAEPPLRSISFDELACAQNISAMLAQTRLLAAEQLSLVCRDESIEGLRFYVNAFLTRTNEV